jgi:gliding motility-associated-like protein
MSFPEFSKMRLLFSLTLIFLGWHTTVAQELVDNGGAESPLWMGWTQANPADTWIQSAQRPPHSGSFHFYPNQTQNPSSELYQDINVSSNAAAIDAGTASYTFSGWRRGYYNPPSSFDMDRSEIIVEYRDASGNVLASYDTGSAVYSSWTNNTDTRDAPIGTRTVRIRLISVRVTGSDNDGYYDDISFVQNNPACSPPTSVVLTPGTATNYCLGSTMTIAGVASPTNANYYYTWYLNGTAITTASQTYTPYTKSAIAASDAGTYTLRIEDGNNGTASCYKEASVIITIDALPVAGTISSNQEICLSYTTSALTGTAGTGGVTIKNYKWQGSTTSAAGPWTTAQAYSTTATGYAPGAITATTFYRRIDSSGSCLGVATNTIKIQVDNKALLNPITSVLRDTLCTGENFQLTGNVNTTSQPSLNGGYYYSWRKTQGTTSSIVSAPSATLTSYPTTAKSAVVADSGTYYLIVQDGASATLCKDSVKIIIRINQAPLTKGLIQSSQEICLHSSASILTEVSPPSNFTGSSLYYQWYTTKDTTGVPVLTKIAASTINNYDPGIPILTKYYVRKDSIKYCAAVATNFVKVRINNTVVLDSIRATVNDTLCENLGDQFQLKGYIDSITAGKASVNGGYYFTWKKVQLPSTTAIVVGTPGKYSDYPAVSRPVVEADSGTYYLVAQDGQGATKCMDSILIHMVVFKTCVAVSCSKPDAVSIKVSAASNDKLCTGSKLILQKDVLIFPATPPVYGYMYSWIRTNTLGTVVVQAPSTTYQDYIVNTVSLADSGRYQLIVQDGTTTPAALCSETSQPISIVVYSPVTAAQIGSDTTICSGNSVLPFAEQTANTGGTGTYAHQWQSSSDNISFTDLAGQTNSGYQSPAILNTTYFRRMDQSGVCPAAYSNTVTVTTTTGVTPGSIAIIEGIVCYNTIPTKPIANTTEASGGTGGSSSLFYQWQQSTDNINWTDIAGAHAKDYSVSTALTNTIYYRRKAGMGPGSCDTAYTTSIFLNAYPALSAGSIGNNQHVCAGASVTLNEIAPANGGGAANTQTYQWIESADKGITWSTAPGNSTQKNYTSTVLSDSVWYKRVTISACGQDSSNNVSIAVSPIPVVSAGTDLHAHKNDVITLQGSVSNAAGFIWKPATGLSNASILNPDATISNTITYTLYASDPSGLCSTQSSVTISVEDAIVISNVLTPNGDGRNDTWSIEHIEDFPDASFMIYNRWGNIVWKHTGNTLQWNGTNYRNGEMLPEGTYFYIIDLKSETYPEPYTGYIQIIK